MRNGTFLCHVLPTNMEHPSGLYRGVGRRGVCDARTFRREGSAGHRRSSGIGRATALALAEEGAKVVVSARSVDGGHETVAGIRDSGGEAMFVRADVSIASDIATLVQTTVDTYGRLDCAHNNAGVGGAGFLPHEYPEDLWDRNMTINLKGVWLCLKYEVRTCSAKAAEQS